jgi:hypothetical protein
MTAKITHSTRIHWGKALFAISIAVVFNHFCDRFLGAHVEVFTGLKYFSGAWIADVFIVPLIGGIMVSYIYGMGGKWICYFPPVIVRLITYYQVYSMGNFPVGASLEPFGWWGFIVILAMESAVIGGIIGEVIQKKVYGRTEPSKRK